MVVMESFIKNEIEYQLVDLTESKEYLITATCIYDREDRDEMHLDKNAKNKRLVNACMKEILER